MILKNVWKDGYDDQLGNWYTSPKQIVYGNVTHTIAQLSQMGYFDFYGNVIKKHPRKPTEIVVYTDAFCFSCCSIVTKGFKEHGSAIVVGYNGNPLIEGTMYFDVGQSPTSVEQVDTYTLTEEMKIFKQYGLTMGFSFFESFRHNYNYNETIPREFLVDEIDERSPISEYLEESISMFSNYTKYIVQKYTKQCNKDNKRLVLIDNKCDEIVHKIDEHAFGGYECGNNGKWSDKCVIAGCHEGFLFDFMNQKCIEDVCYNRLSDATTTMLLILITIIIGCLLVVIIFIVIIVLLIVCLCKKKKKGEVEMDYVALQLIE